LKSRERIRTGFEQMTERKVLFLLPAVWLLVFGMAAYMGKNALQNMGSPFASDLFGFIFVIMAAEIAVVGVCAIMSLAGTPLGATRIEKELTKAGFADETGESPMLLSRRSSGKGIALEFFSTQIPLAKYEENKLLLETVLNIKILSFEMGRDMRHTVIKALSLPLSNSKILPWQDCYLSDKDFELVLGEGYFGIERIDISLTPHLLIGGSSGSGKSKLLKLILMESIKKGAIVFLADFKGGVDYPTVWHQYCNIITEQSELDSQLTQILDEMERRRSLLVSSQTSNIGDYNTKAATSLPRLIVACDEIAEVLDKTGLTKEEKELVGRVESKLSTIARQGRAFGIHLVLSTQRPDAEILKGQIKNNIGYRVCGRADKILSNIILDKPDAADTITPQDQGMFLTNTDVLFQAYYVEDDCLKGVAASAEQTL
jgi:S-DNA-T family DNA segregation ATPase FtsK/SpoIIIE